MFIHCTNSGSIRWALEPTTDQASQSCSPFYTCAYKPRTLLSSWIKNFENTNRQRSSNGNFLVLFVSSVGYTSIFVCILRTGLINLCDVRLRISVILVSFSRLEKRFMPKNQKKKKLKQTRTLFKPNIMESLYNALRLLCQFFCSIVIFCLRPLLTLERIQYERNAVDE